MSDNSRAKPKIGLLVKTFPKVSETFILGEILGLEERGLPLVIFSLQLPTDDIVHSKTASVKAPIIYLSNQRPGQIVSRHVRLFLRSPSRYLLTLIWLFHRVEGNRLSAFVQAACLAEQARESGVGHLHAHFANEPAGVAEMVGRFTDLPFSISAHAKDIYLSRPDALCRKMEQARFVVTCTEYNRRYLQSIAKPHARLYRMYHGIDLERFSSNADRNTAAHSAPLILSVGRLREKKGFRDLIEACAVLAARGVSMRCQIIGYGPDRKDLQHLIRERRLEDKVQIIGKLTQDEVITYYRRATLFVLPCLIAGDGDRDGIPNVLLEAMAMGLPVITTPVSGIPEVVRHDSNGLLVPPNDAEKLAGQLAIALGDQKLRRRLSAAAEITVSRMFSNERNLQLLAELLIAILNETPNVEGNVSAAGHAYDR